MRFVRTGRDLLLGFAGHPGFCDPKLHPDQPQPVHYLDPDTIRPGGGVIAKALVPNEMFTRENRGGNGISRIQAGPTCAVDDCCYIKKIDLSPNVQGTAWRVDIYGDRLELYDCTTWTKVASATGNMTNCPSCNKTNAMVFGAGTGPTETRGTE